MSTKLGVRWFGKDVQDKVARAIGKRFEAASKKTKYYIMARLNIQNQNYAANPNKGQGKPRTRPGGRFSGLRDKDGQPILDMPEGFTNH